MILKVRVKTNSSNTAIVGDYGDMIKVSLKSSPVDNQANEELIKFLSKLYKVDKTSIKIIKGLKSKNKVLEITV